MTKVLNSTAVAYPVRMHVSIRCLFYLPFSMQKLICPLHSNNKQYICIVHYRSHTRLIRMFVFSFPFKTYAWHTRTQSNIFTSQSNHQYLTIQFNNHNFFVIAPDLFLYLFVSRTISNKQLKHFVILCHCLVLH